MYYYTTNNLISPPTYIITATISTTNNAKSFSRSPAYAHNPEPMNPNQRFSGKILRLVSAIPIRHSIVPVHFIMFLFLSKD